MPDNDIGWGQGAVNNDTGWGKAYSNNDIGFGAVYPNSPSGDTNLIGGTPTPPAPAGIANNYSMNFDSASSDYISIGTIDSLNTSQNFSISLWFNENLRKYTGTLFSSGTGTGNLISVSSRNGVLNIYVGSSGYTPITSVSLNTWHHVVLTVENTTAKVYINNGSPTTNTVGSINSSSGNLAKIGDLSFASGYYFDGIIDELGIWNTALTSTQVSEIYNATGTNLTKDLTTVSGSNLIYWNRMGD